MLLLLFHFKIQKNRVMVVLRKKQKDTVALRLTGAITS